MIEPANVRHLVFSGGGVRGYSYAGVLSELASAGVKLDKIEGAGGTSIGAMFALALVCGWTPAEIVSEMAQRDVKQMLCLDLVTLFSQFGVDRGDKVRAYLDTVIVARCGTSGLTLQQLHARTGKRLYMIACDLNNNAELLLDHETAPDLSAADACFMSMAVPGLFAPFVYKERLCVDGGIKNNFPLNYFPADSTLGVRVCWGHAASLHSVDQVMARVVYCILSESEKTQWNSLPLQQKRNTINVQVGDLTTIELQLTRAHKHLLINTGRLAVRHALTRTRTVSLSLYILFHSLVLIGQFKRQGFHGDAES